MAKAQFFRITDFSGGYNPDVSPHSIQDNQAVDIMNFRLDQVGSLVSRQGTLEWGDPTEGVSPLSAIAALVDPAVPNNSHVVVVLNTGDIMSSASGTAWSSRGRTVGSGDPAGVPRALAAQDSLYIATGVATPVKLGLTGDAESAGVSPPASAPAASAVSGGSLAGGTYRYAYTVVRTSDGTESNPSPDVSAVASGGDLSITLTLPAAATGTTRNVYRTDVNSVSGVFKLLGNFGTSTSVTDDGSVATSDLAPPFDHDPAPNLEHMAYYGGRFFGAIGDKVYWSYPLNAAYWPALNVTTLPFLGNDRVQALVSFQDALLIFGRRNTLLLTGAQDDGSTMGSWQVVRLDAEIGLSSPDAVAELGGQILFLSDEGLRTYPGFQIVAPQIQRELTTLGYGEKASARMGYVAEERSAWLAIGDKTYVIHLPNQAVTFYDIHPGQMLSGGRTGNDHMLYLKGTAVRQYGGTEAENGATPIALSWKSKLFQVGMPESVKYFRRIGAFASKGTGAGVTITVRDRGEMFTVSPSQVSGLGEARWNEFNWNESSWAGGGLAYFTAALPAQRLSGRSMQVEIRAEVTQSTEVAPPISLLYREANRFLGV